MTAIASAELIVELEAAVKDGSPERRVRILRRLTELFVAAACQLNPGQIRIFADLLARLIDRMELAALIELSTALAGVKACAAIEALSRIGKLNDSAVNRFAIRREYANVVAALSLLSGAAVDVVAPPMEESSGEGLIIACRASRLNWQTTLAIISNRRVPPPSKPELEQAKQMFEMLYVSAAQYTMRFEPPGNARVAQEAGDGVVAVAGAVR